MPRLSLNGMKDDRRRLADLQALGSALGIQFADVALLDRALTHASASAELESETPDYEALEFLGDAVLGLAVAEYLYTNAPDRTPGEYSRMRAAVVNRRTLARVANALDLGTAIRLGRGEELSGGRRRRALLADCMEAVIGAFYLDQGLAATAEFIERVFCDDLEAALSQQQVWDYKSRLQHYCQANRMPLPAFKVVRSEGPDHCKEFEMEVTLGNGVSGRGIGLSKKEAEQKAARAALDQEGQLAEYRRRICGRRACQRVRGFLGHDHRHARQCAHGRGRGIRRR
jgi:ribonuclease III